MSEWLNIAADGLPVVESVAGGQHAPPGHAEGQATAPALNENRTPPLACPAIILEVFGDAAPAACAIAFCESRYGAWAVGDHGASLGLFQIQPRWHQWRVPGEDLMDADVNTRAAWLISNGGRDWSAWTCRFVLGYPTRAR